MFVSEVFIWKDTIQVDCVEVAGKKQLVFRGIVTVEPVVEASAAPEASESPAV